MVNLNNDNSVSKVSNDVNIDQSTLDDLQKSFEALQDVSVQISETLEDFYPTSFEDQALLSDPESNTTVVGSDNIFSDFISALEIPEAIEEEVQLDSVTSDLGQRFLEGLKAAEQSTVPTNQQDILSIDGQDITQTELQIANIYNSDRTRFDGILDEVRNTAQTLDQFYTDNLQETSTPEFQAQQAQFNTQLQEVDMRNTDLKNSRQYQNFYNEQISLLNEKNIDTIAEMMPVTNEPLSDDEISLYTDVIKQSNYLLVQNQIDNTQEVPTNADLMAQKESLGQKMYEYFKDSNDYVVNKNISDFPKSIQTDIEVINQGTSYDNTTEAALSAQETALNAQYAEIQADVRSYLANKFLIENAPDPSSAEYVYTDFTDDNTEIFNDITSFGISEFSKDLLFETTDSQTQESLLESIIQDEVTTQVNASTSAPSTEARVQQLEQTVAKLLELVLQQATNNLQNSLSSVATLNTSPNLNFGNINTLFNSNLNALGANNFNTGLNLGNTNGLFNPFGSAGLNGFSDTGLTSLSSLSVDSSGNTGFESFGNTILNGFGTTNLNGFGTTSQSPFGTEDVNGFGDTGVNAFGNTVGLGFNNTGSSN